MVEINLEKLTGNGEVRNLAGHDRGQKARAEFNLDGLDVTSEPVTVVVPDEVYLLTPSFIQGMFAESIKRLGSRERFLRHYGFRASGAILRQIDSGITASLVSRGSLLRR